MGQFEYYPDEEDDDEVDEYDAAMMNCGMGDDGQCGHAGSEYCDFDCPFRDDCGHEGDCVTPQDRTPPELKAVLADALAKKPGDSAAQ